MTRQTRTLVVIVVIALAGVTTLAWMAQRYKTMVPQKSVRDLDVAPRPAPVPPPSPVEPEIPPPVEAAPEKQEALVKAQATAEPAAGADEASARDVELFLEVRRALREVVDASPRAVAQLAKDLDEGVEVDKRVPLNMAFLQKYRLRRHAKLEELGLSPERYAAIREGYLSWKAGGARGNSGLSAALEARRADLESVDLGPAERFDALLAF